MEKGLVGNAHRIYEQEIFLLVQKIPSVNGLTVLLLKQATISSHRAWPDPREWAE